MKRSVRLLLQRGFAITALCLAQSSVSGAQQTADRQGVYLAPGWGKLSFAAPAAGSYELPVIDTAAGGEILDSNGKSLNLDALLGEKVTLLSFIYRTCDDVNGCPLSTMVLSTIGNKIAGQPQLAGKLRLLTLSFDPEFDTPEVMREYGESILGNTEMDWQFLTSASENKIQPILQAYQQSVVADVKAAGAGQRKFSHLLRVYLIDQKKQVRNIYSLSFIHPDILINDVKTLLIETGSLEPGALESGAVEAATAAEPGKSGTGDPAEHH